MNNFYIFLFAALLSAKVQSQPQELWKSQFHISDDVPEHFAVDHDDNLYVLGRVRQSLQPDRLTVVKYNPQGEELWHKLYIPENASLAVSARAFAVDAAGHAIAVARVAINQNDIVVAKYSPEGDLLWDYIFNHDEVNGHDNAHYATTDAGLNVYVCGASINTLGHYSMLILKFSPQGELLLNIRKEWSPTGTNRALHMAIDSEGNLLVTGRRHGPPSGHYVLYKLDPEGNTLWTDTYQMPNNNFSEGRQVIIDADDNIYVCAQFGTYAGLQAYTPQGELLWRDIWQEEGMIAYLTRDMAFDHEGHIIILGDGTFTANNSNKDWFLLKYNVNGEHLWHTYFNGSGNGNDEAVSLAMAEDGELVAYGQSREGTALQNSPYPSLARFDADGNEQWRVHAPESSNDLAGMVVLSTGTPVLSYGALFSGESNNFVTASYGEDVGLNINSHYGETPGLLVYPNPGSEFVRIDYRTDHRTQSISQNGTLRVFNMGGIEVHQARVALPHVLDVGIFAQGVYLVELIINDERIVARLIVK